MKEWLLDSLAYVESKRKNFVREQVQASILSSLQRSGAMVCLGFMGGSALRFLHNLPRYSEDLDFTLERRQGYDFRGYLEAIVSDLRREGYAVEAVKPKDLKAVHSAFVRFPRLLEELNLASKHSRALAVKIEIDTNPPAGARLTTTVVRRRDVILRLHHHDPASLLAGKLHAVLQRPWPKGRDFYDLIWYLSDRDWPQPNVTMLNNALRQTRWRGPDVTKASWRTVTLRHVRNLDWGLLKSDVLPLLERPSDIDHMRQETLVSLLRNKPKNPHHLPRSERSK